MIHKALSSELGHGGQPQMFLNSLGLTNLSHELDSAPFTKQQYTMETMGVSDKTDLRS